MPLPPTHPPHMPPKLVHQTQLMLCTGRSIVVLSSSIQKQLLPRQICSSSYMNRELLALPLSRKRGHTNNKMMKVEFHTVLLLYFRELSTHPRLMWPNTHQCTIQLETHYDDSIVDEPQMTYHGNNLLQNPLQVPSHYPLNQLPICK